MRFKKIFYEKKAEYFLGRCTIRMVSPHQVDLTLVGIKLM